MIPIQYWFEFACEMLKVWHVLFFRACFGGWHQGLVELRSCVSNQLKKTWSPKPWHHKNLWCDQHLMHVNRLCFQVSSLMCVCVCFGYVLFNISPTFKKKIIINRAWMNKIHVGNGWLETKNRPKRTCMGVNLARF